MAMNAEALQTTHLQLSCIKVCELPLAFNAASIGER
jgi:hypothetical protein